MASKTLFFCLLLLVLSQGAHSYEWDTISECQKSLREKRPFTMPPDFFPYEDLLPKETDTVWDDVRLCQMEQQLKYLKTIADNQAVINKKLDEIYRWM